MAHRYHVGQTLELRPSPLVSNRPAGLCEVRSCLPIERGVVQYRVKSEHERGERVVDEIDLSPSSSSLSAAAQAAAPFDIAISRK